MVDTLQTIANLQFHKIHFVRDAGSSSYTVDCVRDIDQLRKWRQYAPPNRYLPTI